MPKNYRMELCCVCIDQFNRSLTYRVKTLQSYRKCVCGNCGKEGLGANCSVETLSDTLDRLESTRYCGREAR